MSRDGLTVSSNNNVENVKHTTDFSAVKSKLERQINELKSLILQMESNLDIKKFGNCKVALHPNIPNVSSVHVVADVNVQLQNELYRYAGFNCVKFSKTESIFNFLSSNKYEPENTYAVQFLKTDGKVSLGKWVMPMSIDLEDIVSDFQLDETREQADFLKLCKHYIDCNTLRTTQFEQLKESVSNMKNCRLQSNPGCTLISLELLGVYNKMKDAYMDIVIYIIYNIGNARPYKIQVDSKTEARLNEKILKQMKPSLKLFKLFDLQSAFDKIFTENDQITWSREDDDDTPLVLHDISNSEDDGFLDSLTTKEQKSLTIQKRKKMKTVKKRNKKQKQNDDVPVSINITKTNEQTVDKEKQVSLTQESETAAITATPANNMKPTVVQQKILRQTKLRFQLHQQDSGANDNTPTHSMMPPDNKVSTRRTTKLFTSTPQRQNISKSIAFPDTSAIVDNSGKSDRSPKRTVDATKQQKIYGLRNVSFKMIRKKLHLTSSSKTMKNIE